MIATATEFVNPQEVCSKTIHATGFSQWLMTNFLSAEFIRRQLGGHDSCCAEIFFFHGRAGTQPSEKKFAN